MDKMIEVLVGHILTQHYVLREEWVTPLIITVAEGAIRDNISDSQACERLDSLISGTLFAEHQRLKARRQARHQ